MKSKSVAGSTTIPADIQAENQAAEASQTLQATSRSPGIVLKTTRNVGASLARVGANAVMALVLPAYLTHRLPVSVYGAWVLILQIGAYVYVLDFGIQTAISKFVAEFEAKGRDLDAGRYASAGLGLMSLAAMIGVVLTGILAWLVPHLFQKMPPSLYSDVRISILLIGFSLSLSLVSSVFSAVFMGLQRYSIPMAIAIANKAMCTIAVLAVVFLHGSLTAMAAATALVNIGTGFVQFLFWKRFISRIPVRFGLIEPKIVKQMSGYCSILAIWSAAMLCISGLDLTIVGHYDFPHTAYYAIASSPNNLFLMILSAALGPLLPVTSALSAKRGPQEMGRLLLRATEYMAALLLVSGVAMLIFAYPVLKLWVGRDYAIHAIPILRFLIVANVIRNLCAPYSTMVVAVGRQKAATAASIVEAAVNLGSSLYLAMHLGAVGVAIGTLLGALVGVAIHILFSMRYTSDLLAFSRGRLVGVFMRSAVIAFPALIFWSYQGISGKSVSMVWLDISLFACTLLLAWGVGLNSEERSQISSRLGGLLRGFEKPQRDVAL